MGAPVRRPIAVLHPPNPSATPSVHVNTRTFGFFMDRSFLPGSLPSEDPAIGSMFGG